MRGRPPCLYPPAVGSASLPDRIAAVAERLVAAPAAPGAAPPRVVVDPARKPHPLLPDLENVYVEQEAEALRLYAGSFAALVEAHDDLSLEDEVEAHVETALEDRAAAGDADDEDALFRQHARFRRGEPLPHAWYRAGEPAGPHAWIVDLDVFVEVWLSEAVWKQQVGGVLRLTLDEDVLEVELPEDADPAEVLTLEGAGLFESEPFEDEPLPPTGDLHLVFFVV